MKEKKLLEEDIEKLLSLFSDGEHTKKYFDASIKRFASLKERLSEKTVRVGVIGITSSGKSTLLNTILDEKLLPTRVGPSSSKQVICGFDEQIHADILFEEETKKEKIIILQDIAKQIAQYGDEKNNFGNQKQVSEIQVFSPKFKFNKQI